VWRNWREGTALNVVDPLLAGSRTEIMRCIHIGLLCVQENEADRPTMSSVVVMLSSHSLTLPMPSDPAYVPHHSISVLSDTKSEDDSRLIVKHQTPSKSKNLSVDEDTIMRLVLSLSGEVLGQVFDIRPGEPRVPPKILQLSWSTSMNKSGKDSHLVGVGELPSLHHESSINLEAQFHFCSESGCYDGIFKQGLPTFFCVDTNGNYTNNSTYKKNLNTLLSSITSNTQINYGFYNFSAGRDPDQVNGIGQCRGDASVTSCHSCLNTLATKLIELCPTQKEAIGWYDDCMLRYSNRSIFGVEEDSPSRIIPNGNSVSDVDQFSQTLGGLLSSLQNLAASGDSRHKFAIGEANVSSFEKIYALMQCTPDLSLQDCFNCLGSSINGIPNCCRGSKGAQVLKPSCILRYEIYLFYDSANVPPPSSQPPPPPPPTTTSTNTTDTRGKRKLKQSLAVLSANHKCFQL
ncbi:hypothetical protein Ancab_005034, partial [Ancistrocladus abbreviatus]